MLRGSSALCFRTRLTAILVGLGLILLCRGGAWGEGQSKERSVLGLKELIKMAIARSPELAAERSDLAIAQSHLDQAKAGYYPQVDTTAVIGPVNDAEEPVIQNNKIHDPSPGTGVSTLGIFGRVDIKVTQPLYTFGKLSNRKEAAGSGIEARKFGITGKENEIALRVTALYYALIVAKGGIASSDEARGFFDDAGKRIRGLLDLNARNVTEGDLYRVEAFRADTLRSRAEAQKGIKFASFALKALIGLPPEAAFEVPKEEMRIDDGTLNPMESYVQKALSERPELKQLKEAITAQGLQVEAARSDRYPSIFLALVGSGAYAPGRDRLDNPYISDEFNHAYASLVAGMNWEFDFGIKKARIAEAMAEYEKLDNNRAAAEMNIPIQVAKAYQDILEWKEAAATYQEASVASRKWVFSAFSDFDMGVGTADNMLWAIEKYGHNRGKYLEALFNYHTSLAELEYATGVRIAGGEGGP